MCISIVSCSSKGSEIDLGGAVLEGYEDVPFRKLIRVCCENAEREMKEEDDVDAKVTYKFLNGWDTDIFDESDYASSKQATVTCSIVLDAMAMTVTMDYYLVLDRSSNTLEVIGSRFYTTDGKNNSESFDEGNAALEELKDFLSYYNRYD